MGGLHSAYFDITVHCPLQESLLSQSSVSISVAAARREEGKDAHHDELVQWCLFLSGG